MVLILWRASNNEDYPRLLMIMKNVQIYPTREIDVSEFVNEFKQCVLSMLSTAYTT
jgi:hypothetical protein